MSFTKVEIDASTVVIPETMSGRHPYTKGKTSSAGRALSKAQTVVTLGVVHCMDYRLKKQDFA